MSTSEIVTAIDDAIGAGNLVDQSKVNTDLRLANRLQCIGNLALEVHVPAAPRILGEAPGLDDAFDRAGQPQPEAMPTIRDGVVTLRSH